MKTNNTLNIKNACKLLALAGITAALTACGGGGTTSSQSVVQLSGTAATGAALGGATITVTCKSGTGTATADANGSYALDVVGSGPCLLTATSGTLTYTSVAAGSGTVNVTPLTTMLTTYLATQAGTSVTNMISSANGASIIQNAAAVSAAETAVAAAIAMDFGVTLSTSNFLSTSIVPGNSTADTDLDNLASAGVVGANGAVTAVANDLIVTAAAQATPYVAPSGA